MLTQETVTQMALELGFDLVGVAPAGPAPGAQAFIDWLTAGYAGEMGYMARDPQRRLDPRQVLPGARSVVVVGVSYDTQAIPLDMLHDPSRGRIARYAWGADYHDVITPRLRLLGERLARESRAYVDTGPVLERAWAERCGLGFIGRNTCLIHRTRGSYMFLGAVLLGEEIGDSRLEITEHRTQTTDEALLQPNLEPPISNPQSHGCGNCTRCLTACPTQAFAGPGVLDARRCISYLTIELKGSIPLELRPLMGNWIFGCDVCQDVCPYVRRFSAQALTREQAFYPSGIDRAAPHLLDVLALDRASFNARYKGTPLLRAKRRGLLRNACVAAGNWGNPEALPALQTLLNDDEPLLREHAAWAVAQIQSRHTQ
jgi:epoxyqueuosine reductase